MTCSPEKPLYALTVFPWLTPFMPGHRCVINLTNAGVECLGVGRRVAMLRDHGVSRILSDMQKDRALGIDIRERIKTALENFVALDMFTE
jgi:hypothetical protein